MRYVRRSDERGHANHGWLDSYHTFSFADYYDPKFMGFSVLRVINEDKIAGGEGFPTHPHRDMEIITYIIDGELKHRDTLGNEEVIKPGEVQRMSAGTGIRHSEFNALEDRETHLLQIWLLPEKTGIEPGYEQKDFSEALSREGFTLVASRDARDGSVKIHQDVDLFAGRMKSGAGKVVPIKDGRSLWLQIIKGKVAAGPEKLRAGDALAVSHDKSVELRFEEDTEFLLFDLP